MPDPATPSVHSAECRQCSSVGSGGFVRFQSQLAITASARMLTSENITVRQQPAAPKLAEHGSTGKHHRLLEIKAERRINNLGGMRQSQKVFFLSICGRATKPARNFSHSSKAISIHWRPILRPGPLSKTFEPFPSAVTDSTFFGGHSPLRVGVQKEEVVVAQQRLKHIFERRRWSSLHHVQPNSSDGPSQPNWISA